MVDVTADGLPDVVVPGSHELQVLVNQRNDRNRPPVITPRDATLTVDFATLASHYGRLDFRVEASDPDQHALQLEWRVEPEVPQAYVGVPGHGMRVGRLTSAIAYISEPGKYHFILTASDQRGGVVTRTVSVITVTMKEIVLYAAAPNATMTGHWTRVADPTAAGGVRAYDLNFGAPKVLQPSQSPANSVTIPFVADVNLTYKLWIRLKAANDYWANDSVWVQFTSAPYLPVRETGLAVSLEACVGCGVSGWGWRDSRALAGARMASCCTSTQVPSRLSSRRARMACRSIRSCSPPRSI